MSRSNRRESACSGTESTTGSWESYLPCTPGDILLVDDYGGQGDLIGNLIRAGERAQYGVGNWTHSALIVSPNGDIVEALSKGVRRTNLRKYHKHPTKVLHLPVPANDPRREYAVRYALATVGQEYGVVGFIGLAISLLTKQNISIHWDRQPICSEDCARATESTTDHGYEWSPERMMPMSLDVAFGAEHGPPLPLFKRWGLLFKALYWWAAPWKTGIMP